MAGINDLKNNGKDTKPFFPTAVIEESVPIVSVEIEDIDDTTLSKYHNKGSVLSMTSGAPTTKTPVVANMETRVKADLSHLPEDENESLGVDKRESITKDILGPGGIFEEYVAKQKQEMVEFIEDQELEAEISGETVEKSEDELLEEEAVVTVSANESYKEIKLDLSGATKATQENKEDSMESNINVVEEATPVEEVAVEENVVEESLVETIEEVEDSEVEEIKDTTEENSHTVGFEEGDITIGREMVEDTSSETEENDEDSEVEESADVSEDEDDVKLEILKSMITEKLKPISTRMSLSGFTVAKKGTTSNNILESKEVPVAKWVLPSTGIVVKMKEIMGSNLEKVRFALSNNDARTALQLIYSHIVTPKPATLEGWMKTIAYDDYDHLFMAMYIASFTDSNYIPIDCTNKTCKQKTYLTDNMPIMEMVKFKDDESKAKWMKIYQSDAVESKGLIPTEIVPVSESFAIGFVQPSIYSVMIETGYMDDAFLRKYNNTVTMAPYIDQIYKIDQATKQLIPIEWKEYSNNIAKSIKSKIVRFDKIFGTMNADELAIIRAYINEINNKNDLVSYQIPETTCPHCGHVNSATPDQSASSLVFLRNQLGLLVTT